MDEGKGKIAIKNRDKNFKSRDSDFLPTARLKFLVARESALKILKFFGLAPGLKSRVWPKHSTFESPKQIPRLQKIWNFSGVWAKPLAPKSQKAPKTASLDPNFLEPLKSPQGRI